MILTHGSDPNQVALTFDDGPNGNTTLELVKVMARHNAKATFFMLGKWVKENPQIALEVYKCGHDIGNHGFSHTSIAGMEWDQIADELQACAYSLAEALEFKSHSRLFRPPYGKTSEVSRRAVYQLGCETVLWSQLSGDWAAKSPEEIISKVNLDTDKGEIVLLHDGGPDELGADRSNTIKAVEMILQKWPNKQYVTVSELKI